MSYYESLECCSNDLEKRVRLERERRPRCRELVMKQPQERAKG